MLVTLLGMVTLVRTWQSPERAYPDAGNAPGMETLGRLA